MAATNTTSARRAVMLQRQQEALAYRRAGSSYSAIAAQLGISKQRAQQLVAAALTATVRENAAEGDSLRALELERLDVAIRAIADRVKAGDLGAIDRWLRISERRARLLGLDAPQDHRLFIQQTAAQMAAASGQPESDIMQEFNALLSEVR